MGVIMPHEYVAIRDALMKRGMSKDAAQSEAAAIYNKRHKKNPVTGKEKPHHSMIGKAAQ